MQVSQLIVLVHFGLQEMGEDLLQVVMGRLLVVQSERLMQLGVLLARLLEHDAEVVQGLLLVQVFDDHESRVFLVDDFIFG